MISSMPPSHHIYSDEWEHDVTPDFFVGINSRLEGQPVELPTLTAYEIPFLHSHLPQCSAAELKQIPILRAESRLEPGATYLDLAAHPPREFTAFAEMEAGPDHFYVPQWQVPDDLWNRLLGRHQPSELWTRLTGGDEPDRTSPFTPAES